MAAYVKITDFSVKDNLLTGNPEKVVTGAELDDEFDAIGTSSNLNYTELNNAVDASFIKWTFNSSTTMADPGAGNIRFNHATASSVTAIALDDLTSGSADVSAFVVSWDDVTGSTNKGTIQFKQGNIFAIYYITGLTDNAGWTQLAVTYVSGSGTFVSGTETYASFFRTGEASADVSTVAGISANVTTVAGISANVTTVAGISGNVTTVAGISANVTTVAGISANVTTVATNNANVTAVATDIANVNAVGADLLEPTSEVNTVATDIANVNTVGTGIANVNTVAGISANVTTVAGISANVTTVAGISANVTTVAGISANVTAVAGNATNINAVAADATDIGVVAAANTNIGTVATNIANVNTVAGISLDVSAVAAQFIGWNFSTTTTMADPGSGIMRFNNATLASVTAIALDDLNSAAADISAYVVTWDDATGSVKGTITVRQGTANFAIFNVTGLTDNAGWTEVAVTHLSSSGTFANAILTFVDFDRSGSTGAGITEQATGFTATGGTTPKTLTVDADFTTSGFQTTSSPQFAGINLGHASDTTLTRVSAGVVAVEGVTIATLGANTFTGQQTFAETMDTVYTITDGAAFEIDPVNGNVQIVTLGASRTPAATNFASGQCVMLGIDDGAAYSVTWTTVAPTWVKAGGTGAAPTPATTGYTWVLLWKVGGTMYAAEVGSP